MKTYKIWRFAYTSHAETLYAPDDLKFYCVNKNRSIEGYKCESENKVIWNEHWIAVLPWSEYNLRISRSCGFKVIHSDGTIEEDDNIVTQPLAMAYYEINKSYIIWDFEQIFPLSDDWPETTELPKIETEYIKYLALKIPVKTDILNKLWDEIEYLPDDERTEKLQEKFCPVTQYIKIHGLNDFGGLNITSLLVHSWYDDKIFNEIRRENVDFHNLFDRGNFESVKPSNKKEYENTLNTIIKNI